MTKQKKIALWAALVFFILVTFAAFMPSRSAVLPSSVLKAHTNALRHIAQGLVYYAKDHDGNFPDTLDVLAAYDSGIRKIKIYEHGDIYYLKPQRKVLDVAPKDILLISISQYGTVIAFADCTGSELEVSWKK